MNKKLATIQPNYIPWKGYFDIINMVDEFVLYDDVQYTKNDWRNRNMLKTKNGIQWITIPVSHKSLSQKISETQVSSNIWRKKHWKTICQWYSRAEFFKAYEKRFEDIYLASSEIYLSKINYIFIRTICEILGIHTTISWSTHYQLVGDKIERLVDLCKKAKATEYLTGPSAKYYMEEAYFTRQGISVSYMDYSGYPEYNQLFPPFEHSVSIIDLIFNEGPNAPKFMKSF